MIGRNNLIINFDNINNNPTCDHGPKLLFQKFNSSKNEFENNYVCAAYRDDRLCKSVGNSTKINMSKMNDTRIEQDKAKSLSMIMKLNQNLRAYCYSCNELFHIQDSEKHQSHNIKTNIENNSLLYPTRILHPLDVDKKEAQYFFTIETLQFFEKMLYSLKFKKVLCIGAPRLHEHLKNSKYGFKSYLLDFDNRFNTFNKSSEFSWYNMFNHHFFEGQCGKEHYLQFLKTTHTNEFCIFTDPPFGCRTEALVFNLKTITQEYNQNNNTNHIIPIIWIFPYYMEGYITKSSPEFTMLDYKVNYDNHKTYNNNEKGRHLGSPVRIFTNISATLIELPHTELYKYCAKCNKWVSRENEHCNLCKLCPSKNGAVYKHCNDCRCCVKSYYIHCIKCRRCVQNNLHDCTTYQQFITCSICRKQGHIETNCNYVKLHEQKSKGIKLKRNKRNVCLICNTKSHSEIKCPKRKKLLNEIYFLGEYYNFNNGE